MQRLRWFVRQTDNSMDVNHWLRQGEDQLHDYDYMKILVVRRTSVRLTALEFFFKNLLKCIIPSNSANRSSMRSSFNR